MSNQYFENNPNLESNIKEINYYFKGTNIILYSDNGVFCKSGVDFGTNLLLKSIKDIDNKKILDVGCGYGPIGITLTKVYNTITTMIDINDHAVELTKKAIAANHISAECFHSNIYENITNNYDVIISNPPIRAGKKVVHEIILKAYDHLNNNGEMWCVIQKKQGADSAKKALLEIYQSVEVVAKDKGYEIIKAVKNVGNF